MVNGKHLYYSTYPYHCTFIHSLYTVRTTICYNSISSVLSPDSNGWNKIYITILNREYGQRKGVSVAVAAAAFSDENISVLFKKNEEEVEPAKRKYCRSIQLQRNCSLRCLCVLYYVLLLAACLSFCCILCFFRFYIKYSFFFCIAVNFSAFCFHISFVYFIYFKFL